MIPRPNLARLRGDESGASAIEAAIVLPVLLSLSLGLIDASRMLWIQNSLQDAVDAAARCAVVNATTCGDNAKTASYAAAQMPGIPVAASNFTASTATCGKKVTASYTFSSQVAGLVPVSLNLTADSCRANPS